MRSERMKLVVEAFDPVQAAANPRFFWGNFRTENSLDHVGEKTGVLSPFAGPELSVTTHHFGLQMLHATEVNEADGAVLAEQIITRMRIGVQRLHAKQLKVK